MDKILKAYKEGEISLKDLFLLLRIEPRKNMHLLETRYESQEDVKYFQLWSHNNCVLHTEDKEKAEKLLGQYEELKKKFY
jgi:hypothetical protein